MDWPPDLAREPASGEIPRVTRNDACVVHAPCGRFVLGGFGNEPNGEFSQLNFWRLEVCNE